MACLSLGDGTGGDPGQAGEVGLPDSCAQRTDTKETANVTKSGDAGTGTVNLAPGAYTMYCDVPGHRAAGMEGRLIVS